MRIVFSLVILVVIATSVSCIGFRGPEDVRREVVHVTGVELDRTMGVSVGRFGVALVRWFTPEDEIPLKGVRKVQVGVYEVVEPAERRLLDFPSMSGWDSIVEIHEDDEDVFVMIQQEGDRIPGMLVVVAEGDEWVLVRVRGKLERVVESAMRMALEQADHPDLADPAIAEYRASGESESDPG